MNEWMRIPTKALVGQALILFGVLLLAAGWTPWVAVAYVWLNLLLYGIFLTARLRQ